MKARKKITDSVVMKQNLAYAVFLLVAIIMFAIFASICIQSIETEVEHSNEILLESMSYRMDDYVASTKTLSGTVILDERITGIVKSEQYSDISKLDLSALQRDYAQYSLVHDKLDEFFFYFPDTQLLMANAYATVDFCRNGDAAYSQRIASYGFEEEKWNDIIRGRYYGPVLFSMQGAGDDNYLIMVRTLHYPSLGNRFANLIVLLKWEDVTGTVPGNDAGKVFIYNRNSGEMTSPSNQDWSALLGLDALKGKQPFGTESLNMNGKDSVLFYSISDNGYWVYGAVVPRSSFLGIIPGLTAILIGFCVVYVLISLALVAMNMLRHYRWMRSVSDALKSRHDEENEWSGNEYEQITESISDLVSENQAAMNLSLEQHMAVKKSLLRQLVYITDSLRLPTQGILDRYELDFEGCNLLMLVLKVQDQIENSDVLMGEWMEQALIQQGEAVHCLFENDMLICIASSQKEPDELIRSVKEAASTVMDKLLKQHRLSSAAAISDVVAEPTMLNAAYQQVCRVFEHMSEMNGQSIVCYADMNVLPADTLLKYSVQTEKQLFAQVSEGNFNEAFAVVTDTVDRNSRYFFSAEAMVYLASNVLNTIVCAADSVLHQQWTPPDEKQLFEIYSQKSPKDLKAKLKELLRDICTKINNHSTQMKTRKTLETFQKVLIYVEDNYTDPNLNVSNIASAFDMNITALSKMFKTEREKNLSLYIVELRLKKAKEMILQGGRLEDIAPVCGFGSVRTFLRLFKQNEGVTPTQYRNNMLKENS